MNEIFNKQIDIKQMQTQTISSCTYYCRRILYAKKSKLDVIVRFKTESYYEIDKHARRQKYQNFYVMNTEVMTCIEKGEDFA